jgi:hypothetical protein
MLTERARRLEPELTAAARRVNAAATAGLVDDGVAAFMAATARMIDNLEAADRQRSESTATTGA